MAIPKEATEAAFPHKQLIGNNLILRPFSLQHVLALAKMRHPLLIPAEEGKPHAIEILDQLTAVAVMGMGSEELAELLSGDFGEQEIRKRAYLAAASIPIEDIGSLVMALQEQLQRGFSTFVPMRREGDGAAVPLARQ
jgi:hypothetical protein